MSKIRLLPHRTADDDSFVAGPWLVRYPGSDPVEASSFIPDFDYGLALDFGFRVRVDIERARGLTGLAADATIGIYALADCQSADIRVATSVPAGGLDQEVWVHTDAGSLAGSIELSRGITTLSCGSSEASNAPLRAGSRLLDDKPMTVVLEGGLSRFPVVSQAFSRSRYPADAAWLLAADFDDPADPFLGTVRLLINSEHPAGELVLSRDGGPAAEMARSALRTDIVRQLFAILAFDDRASAAGDVGDDSVTGVASSIAQDTLAMDLPSALGLHREDPVVLDGLVQSALGYLGTRES